MNGTRRGLNRTLLALLGLLLIAAAGLGILAGTSRGFALSWTEAGMDVWARIQERLGAARIPGTEISWWTVAVFSLLLFATVLLVCWIASQGTGRSNQVAQMQSEAGDTTVDTAVVSQAVKAALAQNTHVLSTSLQSWKTKGGSGITGTGLKLSVQARKGASPVELANDVEHLVTEIDALLGTQIPVLVRITSGTRSKFARSERVA
ncbi:hypothetical protein [Arthrobacter glacialis]|uniref:Alkaline shock response membrane anchor protein AmaP n=1 Tax=Arthrobacter glacialis TaxID=1664 RepID=A0A2S4A1G4_ARTGL|nr:hypothetical protein [Arthrobacter glacialis]POH75340.1 hypothetical protein CVS27_01695 [Arthrobacter glacialis]